MQPGFSQCLTKVQESMVTHVKVLHGDKGKSYIRSQQAVNELDYLVTFNRNITCIMQDLLEGIYINIDNLTLARRDSYMDYLGASIKQDTLTGLRNAPLHMHSLFSHQLLGKAEEISQHEERLSSGTSQKKPCHYHPYTTFAKPSQESGRKSGVPE